MERLPLLYEHEICCRSTLHGPSRVTWRRCTPGRGRWIEISTLGNWAISVLLKFFIVGIILSSMAIGFLPRPIFVFIRVQGTNPATNEGSLSPERSTGSMQASRPTKRAIAFPVAFQALCLGISTATNRVQESTTIIHNQHSSFTLFMTATFPPHSPKK